MKLIRVTSGRVLDFVTDRDDENQVIWCDETGESNGWVRIASSLAHALLVDSGVCGYRVSIRAPYNRKQGADELCR